MATLSIPAEANRERALKTLASLPPFSPVLNKLLATLSSEDVSLQTVSAIIEKDTVIAGNVLKLVNSAMYGRRGVVTSIAHAASLLGIGRLRNAVLGMSLTRLWNQVKTPAEWSTARFNLHSVATALMSDLLAQRVPVEFPEGAFLAGLFHDIGKLLIVVGLPDDYPALLARYGEGKLAWVDCEREVLGVTHAELSAGAIARWRLPEAIRLAVMSHHDANPNHAEVPLGTFRLASVVRCADLYVNAAGISVEKERSAAEQNTAEPFTELGLSGALPEIVEEFRAQYDALTTFFR